MTLLEVQHLTRRFGGLTAVNAVSLSVEEGEILGLIGPNGAGKSTFFALLAGMLTPSSGRITFQGVPVTGWAPDRAARAGVARTFQIVRIFRSMTVLENVTVASHLHTASPRAARAAARQVLERVGLAGDAERLAFTLTLASKKRLEMARALALRPRLLLLDEVMSGLTPAEAGSAMALVRSLNADGLTILLVEHVMEVVMPLSQRVAVFDHGVLIAEGAPQVVSRDPQVIAAYLGRAPDLDA